MRYDKVTGIEESELARRKACVSEGHCPTCSTRLVEFTDTQRALLEVVLLSQKRAMSRIGGRCVRHSFNFLVYPEGLLTVTDDYLNRLRSGAP